MLILNFEYGTRFQHLQKINNFGLFSTPFSLELNFLLANFLIESSRQTIIDTYLKEKLILSL